MSLDEKLESVKQILDLFLNQKCPYSPHPNDSPCEIHINQQRKEWELDFRTHLLEEIKKLLLNNGK